MFAAEISDGILITTWGVTLTSLVALATWLVRTLSALREQQIRMDVVLELFRNDLGKLRDELAGYRAESEACRKSDHREREDRQQSIDKAMERIHERLDGIAGWESHAATR